MRVSIETPDFSAQGLAALEAEWRALEACAACSFFQSWTWIGCRIRQRFTAPRLVRAVLAGRTVGLALFNRRAVRLAPRALWLHQTGDPVEDSVFIEHNAPLVADGHAPATRAILRVALREGGTLFLGGIDGGVLEAVRGLGVRHVLARRKAPYAVLSDGGVAAWHARLGASTRAQLGRSRRRLEAIGPVAWRRAEGLEEALGMLDTMVSMHQASWNRRGLPGAFAEPAFVRFHQALVGRALPRGELALWRLDAGGRTVGCLYNFWWRECAVAYQSGFDTAACPRASPGLVAHVMAIEAAAKAGLGCYDFLAGEARYKQSLGDRCATLSWLELASASGPRGWPRAAARRLAVGLCGVKFLAGRLCPGVARFNRSQL